MSSKDELKTALRNCVHWTGAKQYVFDSREMTGRGYGADLAGAEIARIITESDLGIDVIACDGYGGMPLVAAAKRHLPERVNVSWVRRERKGYDLNKLVEGPDILPESRVWIVDDILNHGRTFDRIANSIREVCPSCHIMGLIVLVDFEEWGSKQLKTRRFGVHSVFTLPDFNLIRPKKAKSSQRVEKIWQNLGISTLDDFYIRSLPAISGDRLVIGTDATSWVCCDRNTGEIHWELVSTKPALKGSASQPVIVDDRVYLAAYDGVVRCVTLSDGAVIWQNKVDSFIHGTPQLHDGRLYIGTEGRKRRDQYGDIICLDAQTGSEIWRVSTADQVPCSPAIDPDRKRVICGSNDRSLYCTDFDGNLLWEVDTNQLIKGKPCLFGGRVYTASNEGILECRDVEDGKSLWWRQIGKSLSLDCPFVSGNCIIVGMSGEESAIAAIDAETSDIVWYNLQRHKAICNPDGLVVSRRGDISRIDLVTGKTIWRETLVNGCEINQPVVFDRGNAYLVTNTQGLIAYRIQEEDM